MGDAGQAVAGVWDIRVLAGIGEQTFAEWRLDDVALNAVKLEPSLEGVSTETLADIVAVFQGPDQGDRGSVRRYAETRKPANIDWGKASVAGELGMP